jgi:hypothetical protein
MSSGCESGGGAVGGAPADARGLGSAGASSGPAVSGPVDAGPVLLVTVYDPVEAEIIVAKLRSAGIESFVRHEALSTVYGLTVDGAGQQDIMVRSEDWEEAKAALEEAP